MVLLHLYIQSCSGCTPNLAIRRHFRIGFRAKIVVYVCGLTFAFGGRSAGAEQQQVDEVFAVPDQQLLVLLNPAERTVEELTVLHVRLQVLFFFVPGGLDKPKPHQTLRGAVGCRSVHLYDTRIHTSRVNKKQHLTLIFRFKSL